MDIDEEEAARFASDLSASAFTAEVVVDGIFDVAEGAANARAGEGGATRDAGEGRPRAFPGT